MKYNGKNAGDLDNELIYRSGVVNEKKSEIVGVDLLIILGLKNYLTSLGSQCITTDRIKNAEDLVASLTATQQLDHQLRTHRKEKRKERSWWWSLNHSLNIPQWRRVVKWPVAEVAEGLAWLVSPAAHLI